MNGPYGSTIYQLMLVVGILIGAAYWWRSSRKDPRLAIIYFGGLAGAFLGAKLAYLAAEGWQHAADPDRWSIWLSGKSIMGALPGGWIGVEWMKRQLGYRAITGDRFALLLPIPLILGRIGCLNAGCCTGKNFAWGQWPAVGVEITFQAIALIALLILRRKQWQHGQHFHLYLIAYATFRFGHEFLRATPTLPIGLSGYQIIALLTACAAVIAYRQRAESLVA
jgi:phosphatidylglycerol:prolipoprotein diacylglycerol transferase